MKNNKIFPVQDYALESENQSSRVALSTPNVNSVIAGSISLFSSGFTFAVVALSLDIDKTFHESRNQTSFAKNLGEDGKYGFALAISASTFLTTFLLAKNYFKKFDRQNNDQNNGVRASAQLVFSHGDYDDESDEIGDRRVHPSPSFRYLNSSTSSISNNSR